MVNLWFMKLNSVMFINFGLFFLLTKTIVSFYLYMLREHNGERLD